MDNTRSTQVIILTLVLVSLAAGATAQPVITPRNFPLGGGGAAYLTGFESNFYNPANLMVKERLTNFEVGVLQSTLYFDPVLSSSSLQGQFENFIDIFSVLSPGEHDFTGDQRQDLVDRNYEDSKLLSEHQNRADIILAGVSWHHKDITFSLAARMRTATRIKAGRGWYSSEFTDTGTERIRDLRLTQQSNTLYEISFGYAREFMPVSGLFPQLSKLYVGIAPKFIIAGSYFEAHAFSQYRQTGGVQPELVQSFEYYSSGALSSMTDQFLSIGDASGAIASNLDRRFFTDPTGYGLGVDFGLTYVLTFGDELSTFQDQNEREPINRSLRLSFSVTDIGFVRYNDEPLFIENSRDTTSAAAIAPSGSKFIGAYGQHLALLASTPAGFNPYDNPDRVDRSEFSSLLPTSFNAGMLFEINRLKLMADLTLG
ncbi:MAG: DUF5723 family protein, partial [Balneolaceae bacterium]|nr:DUF5723 family protein [Balneolaceae bacterium]